MYPLTAYDTNGRNPVPVSVAASVDSRALSPERKNADLCSVDGSGTSTTAPVDRETRKVINMMCNVKPKDSDGETELTVRIILVYNANSVL